MVHLHVADKEKPDNRETFAEGVIVGPVCLPQRIFCQETAVNMSQNPK
jgi:hypothetical protein